MASLVSGFVDRFVSGSVDSLVQGFLNGCQTKVRFACLEKNRFETKRYEKCLEPTNASKEPKTQKNETKKRAPKFG